MLPSVQISKSDFNTGAVPPSPVGILAIIAASQKGAQNVATAYSRQNQALTDLGYGPLVEYGAYDLAVAQKPVLLVRPTASVAGAYSNFDKSGVTGTSTVATTGTPLDEYANVIITIVTGGTVGVTGITYTFSLDGGVSVSGTQALGTSTTLSIPNTGVSFTLGAGTLNAGDVFTVYTSRPQMSNTDLVTALEALRVSNVPWENVLIDLDANTTTVSTVDTWLSGLEANGAFHGAFLNSRHKNEIVPTTESETAFTTFESAQFGTSASIRLAVGADAGDLPSLVTGVVQPRPVSLALASRCALIPLGEDPAFVSRGAIPGFSIANGSGNPKWHDENLYPNLDSLRLSTFRSLPGVQGTFITNGNILSPSGSDFVYVQHFRTMNAACNVAFQLLTTQLSRGVGKKPPDPITGGVFILDQDAQLIETLVTRAIKTALKDQVVDAAFLLARNDDLSPNSGAILHGQVQIEAFAYIKEFLVVAKFVKTIGVGV